MTQDEIRAMPAGAEMDRLVAERVMGWRRCCIPPVEEARANAEGGPPRDGDWWVEPELPTICAKWGVPAYSTDQTTAFLVVDRIINIIPDTCTLDLGGVFPGSGDTAHWEARFRDFYSTEHEYHGVADSPAEAICRAALDFVEKNATAAGEAR